MEALARAARWLAQVSARPSVETGRRGQVQPSRGIVVEVRNGNLERALLVMERKMRSSGMERLIKARTDHHVKDSEKRVLARKALMRRIKSQELGKKLREILIKKIRSATPLGSPTLLPPANEPFLYACLPLCIL
jgi:small subunit ribosomal protein S21